MEACSALSEAEGTERPMNPIRDGKDDYDDNCDNVGSNGGKDQSRRQRVGIASFRDYLLGRTGAGLGARG